MRTGGEKPRLMYKTRAKTSRRNAAPSERSAGIPVAPLLAAIRRVLDARRPQAHLERAAGGRVVEPRAGGLVARHDRRVRVAVAVAVSDRKQHMPRAHGLDERRRRGAAAAVMRGDQDIGGAPP